MTGNIATPLIVLSYYLMVGLRLPSITLIHNMIYCYGARHLYFLSSTEPSVQLLVSTSYVVIALFIFRVSMGFSVLVRLTMRLP